MEEFFNKELKDYVKYTENYQVIHRDNSIILLPNQESQLLGLIKADKAFKRKLIQDLNKLLNYNIYLSTHGNDVVINREILSRETILPKEINEIIFTYLDEPELL